MEINVYCTQTGESYTLFMLTVSGSIYEKEEIEKHQLSWHDISILFYGVIFLVAHYMSCLI